MSATITVHGARRVVLARFANHAQSYDQGRVPPADLPWLDARGTAGPVPWPVMPMMQGRTAWVKVERVHLPNDAPLFVTTTAASKVAILGASHKPSHARPIPDEGLSGRPRLFIKLNARERTADDHADIRLHLGSAEGPEVHRLRVMTFTPELVPVQPHFVSLDSPAHRSEPPSTHGVDDILGGVRRIWCHYGVTLDIRPPQTHRHVVSTYDRLSRRDELSAMFAAFNVPGFLNLYFVKTVATFDIDAANATRLGFGYPRENSPGVSPPGIVVGEETARRLEGGSFTAAERALLIAHEMGHFFGLRHPVEAGDLNDHNANVWTQCMLMHPNTRRGARGHTDGGPELPTYQGSMVTLKSAWPGEEPEITTVRRTVSAVDWVSQLA